MKQPVPGRAPAELRLNAARLRQLSQQRLDRANALMAERHELLREAEGYEALAMITEQLAARNEVAHG